MAGAISLVGVGLLAVAFVVARYCRHFTLKIKRRWQALSAGVGVAYMFVGVIPDLEEHRPAVAQSATGTLLDVEKRIYLWALGGFVTFVGLSRLQFHSSSDGPRVAGNQLSFLGEIAGFSLYALLIGYLLVHREDPSLLSLALFVFAMGLHLFMVDIALAEQCESFYQPWGRALLIGCVLLGGMLGILDALPDSFTSRLFAFVMGGVIILSAFEELPTEKDGRLWWFVGGAFCYAALLLLI